MEGGSWWNFWRMKTRSRDRRVKWLLKTEFKILQYAFDKTCGGRGEIIDWECIKFGNMECFKKFYPFCSLIYLFYDAIFDRNTNNIIACYVNSDTCYCTWRKLSYTYITFDCAQHFAELISLFGERWFLTRTFVSCFFIASCLCFALAICPGNYRHTKYIPRKTLIRRGCRQCK